jgi:hypothetical protein
MRGDTRWRYGMIMRLAGAVTKRRVIPLAIPNPAADRHISEAAAVGHQMIAGSCHNAMVEVHSHMACGHRRE